VQLADILDELEQSLLELRSLAGALTTPRPQRERMRGDGVDSPTFGAAPAGDMLSVGQEPQLVELQELRRTLSTDRQRHRNASSFSAIRDRVGRIARSAVHVCTVSAHLAYRQVGVREYLLAGTASSNPS
jgi:hypothetical protein